LVSENSVFRLNSIINSQIAGRTRFFLTRVGNNAFRENRETVIEDTELEETLETARAI
jgi:hypothetical protein